VLVPALDALIGAFSTEYRCEQPGDDEVLGRIKRYIGDALENLVAQLCCSDSAWLLQRAA